jgi:hypothetical protein
MRGARRIARVRANTVDILSPLGRGREIKEHEKQSIGAINGTKGGARFTLLARLLAARKWVGLEVHPISSDKLRQASNRNTGPLSHLSTLSAILKTGISAYAPHQSHAKQPHLSPKICLVARPRSSHDVLTCCSSIQALVFRVFASELSVRAPPEGVGMRGLVSTDFPVFKITERHARYRSTLGQGSELEHRPDHTLLQWHLSNWRCPLLDWMDYRKDCLQDCR